MTWLLLDVSPPRAPPRSPNSAHAADDGGAVDALLSAAPALGTCDFDRCGHFEKTVADPKQYLYQYVDNCSGRGALHVITKMKIQVGAQG